MNIANTIEFIEMIESFNELIWLRAEIETDIENETDILVIAELCLEWARVQEEILYLVKALRDD